jgi:hypothetical protein
MLEMFLQCEGIERKRFAPLRIGQSILVPNYAPVPRGPKRCDRRAIAALE